MNDHKWKIDYDNDTGPGDEGFWEWWTVTDGTRSFKCDSDGDAKWLAETLNAREVEIFIRSLVQMTSEGGRINNGSIVRPGVTVSQEAKRLLSKIESAQRPS